MNSNVLSLCKINENNMNISSEQISENIYTPKNTCNSSSEEAIEKNEKDNTLNKEKEIEEYNIMSVVSSDCDISNGIIGYGETSEKIKNIDNKNNSIDLESLNQNIFNITINLIDKDSKTEDGDEADGESQGEEAEEDKKHKINRKNHTENEEKLNQNKKKYSNNYSSKHSSHGSLDDVNNILKINDSKKTEKKNRHSYILQHKKRIKEKKKVKESKEKKNSNIKPSYLKINKTCKENVRRASVATIMLENFFHSEDGSEDSVYDYDNLSNS